MQSTGHSSIHALSLMSTQGSAIVYVIDVPSRSPGCCLAEPVGAGPVGSGPIGLGNFPAVTMSWLLILDVAYTTQVPTHYARCCTATSCIGRSGVHMLREWRPPTLSWCRCANSPAPAMS